MEKNSYTVAGWLAIAAAVLTLPGVFLGIMVEVLSTQDSEQLPVFLTFYIGVSVTHAAMDIYAFFRLRDLLNERFGFHAVDTLIIAIIVLAIALVSVSLASVTLPALGMLPETFDPLFIGIIVLISLPLAVVSIVFAVRLLSLQDDLYGLLKPYVYIFLAAAICGATIILVPLEIILAAISNIVLGLILIRADRPPVVDFV